MAYFSIKKAKTREHLDTVKAIDASDALDIFAVKKGFWTFADLADSLNTSVDQAKKGLLVYEEAASRPPKRSLGHASQAAH